MEKVGLGYWSSMSDKIIVEEKLKARVSKSLKVKKKVEMENIPMS